MTNGASHRQFSIPSRSLRVGAALLGTALCYLMLAAIRWISDMPSVPLALVLSGMVFGATLIDIWLKPARPGASRRQALLAVSEQALFRRGAWTLAAMFFGGVGFSVRHSWLLKSSGRR